MNSVGDLTGALIAEKYELVRLIGRGNMGAVYEARHTSTLKRCAVKVLLTPALAGDEEVVRRFFREARASGLIESEHVVAAFDSGVDPSVGAFYVMERLEGEDLQQTLKRIGPLNPIAAAKIILQAASGLSSAHALSIVHRDVKPANLFLADGPNDEIKVKILDFGVAKVKMDVFHDSLHAHETHSGSMLGTPLYMSPEQVRRASDIDESADVWSLGVVLFESLSGKLPWGSVDSVGELIAAILTIQMPLLQDHAAWVPSELAEIVQRMLSRDPHRRLRNASDLKVMLARVIGPDTRLFRGELTTVDDQERSAAVARVSLADTMIMHTEVMASGAPTVISISPAGGRRGVRFAAAAGVAALLGVTAWTYSRRSSQPAVPALLPAAAAARPVLSVAEPAAALSAARKSLSLSVEPEGVQVTVDGVSAKIKDRHALIEGSIDSVHEVKLTLNGQALVASVTLREVGLFPPQLKLRMPMQSTPKPHLEQPAGQSAPHPGTPTSSPTGLPTPDPEFN